MNDYATVHVRAYGAGCQEKLTEWKCLVNPVL